MMNILFKKTILAALAAMLAFAAFPVTSVLAQGENPPKAEPSAEQLEKVWAHQVKVYEKLGKIFEDTDAQFAKAQELIDRATANGKDASAVQAALNAFKAAVEKSRPMYDTLKMSIRTHSGFDANGRVTDATKAKATVQEVRTTLKELKTSLNGTGKALREAVKAFREANKPVEGTPTQKDS
jgi:DNA repair exonuclease SbcCD ATPase subunit